MKWNTIVISFIWKKDRQKITDDFIIRMLFLFIGKSIATVVTRVRLKEYKFQIKHMSSEKQQT